jgi:hypothetical protein
VKISAGLRTRDFQRFPRTLRISSVSASKHQTGIHVIQMWSLSSKKKKSFSIIKFNLLTIYREVTFVSAENQMKVMEDLSVTTYQATEGSQHIMAIAAYG